jgi:hypothetical protein
MFRRPRSAGTAARRRGEVRLMRWLIHNDTVRKAAQKLPDGFTPMATEPRNTSMWVTYCIANEMDYMTKRNVGDTYVDDIWFL